MDSPIPSNATPFKDPNHHSYYYDYDDLFDRPDVLDPQHIALYLMLSFFSVLGVIGNAIAFYIFFHRRNSGTSVIFILALAGTDFITCLVTVPFTVVFEALQYRLHYDGLCKMYMFFITSTIPYSSFIMAGIAFDRYFCICHPFLHVLTVQRARLVVLCLALPAFAFGIITGMFYGIFMVKDYLLVNGTVLLGTNISKDMAEHPDHPTNFLDVTQLGRAPSGHVITGEVMFVNDSRVHVLQVYRVLAHNDECVMNNFYFTEEFQTWFRRVYTSCYVLCFVTVMVLYVLIYQFIFNRRAMKARRRRKNHYVSVETHAPAPRCAAEAETAMTELHGNGAISSKTLSNHDNAMATTSLIEGKTTLNNVDCVASTSTALTAGKRIVNDCRDVSASAAVAAAAAAAAGGDGEKKRGSTKTTTTTTKTMMVAEREKVGVKNSNNGTTPDANAAGETCRLPRRRGSTVRDRMLYANIKTALMLFVVTLVFIVAFAPAWFMAHQIIPMQLNVFYLYFVYNVANPFIYAFMNQAFREDLKKLLKRS